MNPQRKSKEETPCSRYARSSQPHSLSHSPRLAFAATPQDTWPSKPIRMIVPFPNTAASDALSRLVGERLGQIWGQQLAVDNRPGAGGLIGSDLVRQAAPDGYTFAMVGQPHLSNVLLREPSRTTRSRISRPSRSSARRPNVIVVGKGIDAKTIPDLIAIAKAKPGALNYGWAGIGSSSHLAGALFASKAGINVVHVPFRAAATAAARSSPAPSTSTFSRCPRSSARCAPGSSGRSPSLRPKEPKRCRMSRRAPKQASRSTARNLGSA